MIKKSYKVDEFLLDESFRRYVLEDTETDKVYWTNWQKENPDALDIVENAKEIITFISNRKINHKYNQVASKVYERLQGQIASEVKKIRKTEKTLKVRRFSYAASILLLVGFSVVLLFANIKGRTGSMGDLLKVIVPEGQRSQIVLPDGTHVWLNAGSILNYPANFSGRHREVYVEGEAFFNVAHFNNRSFTVRLKDNLAIKVFGTEFNVKSYNDDNTVETTLVKGKIKLVKEDMNKKVIEELDVKPNEKAVYIRSNKKMEISKLGAPAAKIVKKEEVKEQVKETQFLQKAADDIEVITGWKDDALVFQDETFDAIAKKMERWFGLKIIIKSPELRAERFTGKFVNNESIYQILDIFNRSESIQYATKDKAIIITKK